MDTLNNETVENIGYSVARIHKILEGLSGLLRCVNDYDFLEPEEVYGIGEMLDVLKEDAWKASISLIDKHLVEELREFASEDDLKKMKQVEEKREKMNKEKETKQKQKKKKRK